MAAVWASDISEAVTFAQTVMGEEMLDGYEDFTDHQPDEALALLLSRIVEPDRPVWAYRGRTGPERSPHFETLGNERLNYAALRPFIEEAAMASRLPAALIDAVIRTESGYRPGAVSKAGAQGLMQLMPKTAEALGVDDPFDPRENIMAGARYLRAQYDRFGVLPLAIAAYNAGPEKVARYGKVPPFKETERYVATVLRRFRDIRRPVTPPPAASSSP